MKRLSNFLACAAGVAAIILAFAMPAQAGSRTLSLPSYLANPGGILEVPLSLDNAAGLAAVRVQINFNPEVLGLLTVTAGPLGEAFELSHGNGEGFVQIVLARAEAVAGGSGRLAVLKFQVNAGAVQDLFSELAIADLNFADSTGVVDLRQKDGVVISNGLVAVTLSPNIDNAQNGLPDWWEAQHGLSPFAANMNLDPERDGLTNLMEYAFGGNPAVADEHQRGPQSGTVMENGQTFLGLGFYRRLGDESLLFRVQESPDLRLWGDLNLANQIIGTPQSMGDGTEFVWVGGTIAVTGVNAGLRGFLRLKVDRPQ